MKFGIGAQFAIGLTESLQKTNKRKKKQQNSNTNLKLIQILVRFSSNLF